MKRKLVQRLGAGLLCAALLFGEAPFIWAEEFTGDERAGFSDSAEDDFYDADIFTAPESPGEEDIGPEISGILVSSVNITQEYFPDQQFRQWIASNLDMDKDGILSVQEIESVKEIRISGLGLDDLTGIELFPYLSVLDCSDNYLTELDLSSNSGLEELNCGRNRLETLNLSGLTALKKLDYSGNRILWIDVTEKPLESLSYDGNEYWTSKEKLSIEETGFEIIAMENGRLNEDHTIQAENTSQPVKLSCRYEISRISLQTEDEITDDNGGNVFEGVIWLYLGYLGRDDFASGVVFDEITRQVQPLSSGRLSKDMLAQVTELDVSDRQIKDLSDLKYLSGLTGLYCSDNPIKKLNLSGNPELTTLICTNTGITSLNLSKNKKLEYADVCSNKLTSLNIKELKSLHFLDCRFNELEKVDTSQKPQLEALLKAPQSSYTIDVSLNNRIPYSKLGNFQNNMADGEYIANLRGLEYGADKKSFVVQPFTKNSATVKFDIANEATGEIIGTCTVKAVRKEEKKPALSAPILTKINSLDTVTIGWKKVSGATGYRIMRKEKGSKKAKFKPIATVNATNGSYSDGTGQLNKAYIYSVQAYTLYKGKYYYSKYDSKGLTGKAILKAPKIEKIENGISLVIHWQPVKSAQGYAVWRKEKGTKKWKKVNGEWLDNFIFCDSTAVPGVMYSYQIRAYRNTNGKIYYGKPSYTGYVCKAKINKPKIISVVVQNGVITLKWKGVEGVEAYEVYRSDSEKGEYTKLATVEDKKALSYTDESVFPSGNPYYKIRACVTRNGKMYFSAFSTACTVIENEDNIKPKNLSEYHMAMALSYDNIEGEEQ